VVLMDLVGISRCGAWRGPQSRNCRAVGLKSTFVRGMHALTDKSRVVRELALND
jgi:hypothetical protein